MIYLANAFLLPVNILEASPNNTAYQIVLLYITAFVFLFNQIACFSFIMVACYKSATCLSFIVLEFLIMLLTYLTNHFFRFFKHVIPLKRQGFPLQNFKMKMFIQRGKIVQTWFDENR